MLLDPLRIYRELPDDIQKRLIVNVGASPAISAEGILTSSDDSAVSERFSDGLVVIGVLIDNDAQRLVLDALVDGG